MSKRWLEREGPQWIRENIITREQYERIAARYEHTGRSISLLPLLGGLLVGMSILSFVAANWQQLPELLRIALLLALMLGSYATGQYQMDKERPALGLTLVSIGLFSFGASIILIGQMFHMIAFSSLSIVVWALAGTALAYLFQSRYLGAISLVLLTVAQFHSISSFHTFSYSAFVVLVAGLAYFVYRRQDTKITALWSLSLVIHAMVFILQGDWPFGWFFVPLALLYTAGDWLSRPRQRAALQAPPLAAAYIFGVVIVMLSGEFSADWHYGLRADPYLFVPVLLVLLAVSWLLKKRQRETATLPEWMLFLPFVYAASAAAGILYLAVLFLYSLYVLYRGYQEEQRLQIHFGTGLFLLSAMIAYVKLTWDFMDKSMFFLIGGVLLLGLSWQLNRRNRRFLKNLKEE